MKENLSNEIHNAENALENMKGNTSNEIPNAENTIEKKIIKFKNLSLKDPQKGIMFKILFVQNCNKNKTISILLFRMKKPIIQNLLK